MNFPKILLAATALGLVLGNLTACQTDYKVGDISKAYCSNVTDENREALNRLALLAGLSVPDYCATFGVPVILVNEVREVLESVDAPK